MVHGPGVACGNAVLDWGFVQNEVFATIHAPEEFAAGAAVRLVALAALVLYIAAFAVGLGPIPWLLMAEILPARARGVASSVATLTNWTCSFVVTECFSTVLAALSPQGTFLLFALVCVAGALYVAAKVPETKGVSLDQIEALFNNAHL